MQLKDKQSSLENLLSQPKGINNPQVFDGLKAFSGNNQPGEEQQNDALQGEHADSHRLKVSHKDLINLVGQLSIMFETGLNLMTALECLTLQARTPAMRNLVNNIRTLISEGNPLWVAMARHPRVFSPICVSMVRTGESSGTMGEALSRLEVYLEREDDIRTSVRSSLSYPIFMMVLSVGVLIFLLTFVFPKFEVMFKGHEEALPAPTKFFLMISHGITDYWYLIFPTILALVGTAWWAWKREAVRKQVDPFLLKIPLLGDLLVKMSLSRSFHTLAIMLGGGISILEALTMAKDVAGNAVFRSTWSAVAVEVENGRDLTTPIRENPNVPPSDTQMIAMADRSGRLPEVLTKLSGRYEKEIDVAVKSLIRFVEPSLVICMGFLVGLMVLSLILPIFAMSRLG